jgi:hypothetical protein
MVNYLRPKKTTWRQSVGKFFGWLVVVAIFGGAGLWLYTASGGSPWVWLIFAGLAINYGFSELGDRLDAILWTLQDIRERLPEPQSYDDWPP